MTDQQGLQEPPEQPPFRPDSEYAVQALREELVEEREKNAKLHDRLSYIRAVNLQVTSEAQREIDRRDAIIESQTRTITELRGSQEAADGSAARPVVESVTPEEWAAQNGSEAPGDELSTEGQLLVSQHLEETVAVPGENNENVRDGHHRAEGPAVQIDQPRDVGLDDAKMWRPYSGESEIPPAPEGIAPDPSLVPDRD
jgi:hypothetical protein